MATESTRFNLHLDDKAAFIAAIVNDPEDDHKRLVYSDWLEDHGDPDRARFIRAQVELARSPTGNRLVGPQDIETFRRMGNLNHYRLLRHRMIPLEHEVVQLLTEYKQKWVSELGVKIDGASFQRGFPEVVSMNAGQFMRHGDRLLESTPVTEAILSGFGHRHDDLANSPLLSKLTTLRLKLLISTRHYDFAPLFGSEYLAGLKRLLIDTNCELGATRMASVPPGRLPALELLGLTGRVLPDMPVPEFVGWLGATGLRSLNLGNNRLGTRRVCEIADSSAFPELRELGLSSNNVTDFGALVIAHSNGIPNLTYLDLTDNEIGSAGRDALYCRPGLRSVVDRGGSKLDGTGVDVLQYQPHPDWY